MFCCRIGLCRSCHQPRWRAAPTVAGVVTSFSAKKGRAITTVHAIMILCIHLSMLIALQNSNSPDGQGHKTEPTPVSPSSTCFYDYISVWIMCKCCSLDTNSMNAKYMNATSRCILILQNIWVFFDLVLRYWFKQALKFKQVLNKGSRWVLDIIWCPWSDLLEKFPPKISNSLLWSVAHDSWTETAVLGCP